MVALVALVALVSLVAGVALVALVAGVALVALVVDLSLHQRLAGVGERLRGGLDLGLGRVLGGLDLLGGLERGLVRLPGVGGVGRLLEHVGLADLDLEVGHIARGRGVDQGGLRGGKRLSSSLDLRVAGVGVGVDLLGVVKDRGEGLPARGRVVGLGQLLGGLDGGCQLDLRVGDERRAGVGDGLGRRLDLLVGGLDVVDDLLAGLDGGAQRGPGVLAVVGLGEVLIDVLDGGHERGLVGLVDHGELEVGVVAGGLHLEAVGTVRAEDLRGGVAHAGSRREVDGAVDGVEDLRRAAAGRAVLGAVNLDRGDVAEVVGELLVGRALGLDQGGGVGVVLRDGRVGRGHEVRAHRRVLAALVRSLDGVLAHGEAGRVKHEAKGVRGGRRGVVDGVLGVEVGGQVGRDLKDGALRVHVHVLGRDLHVGGLERHVDAVLAQGDLVGAGRGVDGHVAERLAHDGLIVLRAGRAAVNRFREAGAPGELDAVLAGLPDVLEAAQAVAVAVGRVDHGAVDGRVSEGGVDSAVGLEVELVVAVGGLGGELGLGGAVEHGGLGAGRLAEGELAGVGGELLVVRGLLGRGRVGVGVGGGQVRDAVDLGEAAPVDALGGGLAHLDGEGHAGDLGAVLGVVGAGGEVPLRLVLGRGREDVDGGRVAAGLGGVELAVRDVHHNVVASRGRGADERVHCLGEVRDLGQRLGLGEVRLGKKVVRLGKLGGEVRPGLGAVVALDLGVGRGGERLKGGLGLIGHRRRLGDVVRSSLELDRVVGVAERMDGEGPVAGAVGALGQLAAGGLGKAELDAHGLVHPVVGRELGSVGGERGRAVGVVAVVGPGHGLHVRAEVAVAAARDVDAQELAVGAAGGLDGGRHVRGGLERLVPDARGRAVGLGGAEGEAAVVGLGHGLEAVGVGVDGGDHGVGDEVVLAVAAGERAAVRDEGVGRLEVLEVGGRDLDGDVLEALDVVLGHGVALAVAGHGAAVPGHGLAVGRGEGLAVRRPGGEAELGAVGALDHSRALVAAAVQAVVGGRAGHHVEGALVVLAVRVERVGGLGGTGGLYVLGCPVLGPGQRRVAVGVVDLDQRVDGVLQVSDLLGGLGLGQVLLGKKVLGLAALRLDGGRGPGLGGVVVLLKGGRLVVEVLQLLPGVVGHGLGRGGDVVRGRPEGVGVVLVAEGVDRDLPVAGAVGAGGQLAAGGLGEAELDAVGLVHPVVGRELGAVGGERVGARFVAAVVSPGHGLHVGTEVAVAVAVEVHAQELAERAGVEGVGVLGVRLGGAHDGGGDVRGGLERPVLDAGGGAVGLRGAEGEAAVVGLGHGLEAVGVGVNLGDEARVRGEVVLREAALERLAVGDEVIGRLERFEVGGRDLDGHVLEARDLVAGDGVGVLAVRDARARDGPGVAVGVDEGLLVRVVGRLDLHALGGLDHVDTLEAAAVQAVVHGRAGHHVVSAAVVLLNGAAVAVDLLGA